MNSREELIRFILALSEEQVEKITSNFDQIINAIKEE